jgi:hypothetical protein
MQGCPDITTLEEAEAKLTSSILPIDGLRRDDTGKLTEDALNTIMDGLKSRGIDVTNPETKKSVTNDLMQLGCTASKQGAFIAQHYGASIAGEAGTKLIEKNIMTTDVQAVSRRINNISPENPRHFVEGWQNINNMASSNDKLLKRIARDRAMLEGFTSDDLGKEKIEISQEKNRIASNYLGIYGFLNLFAVGLILYLAASK